VPTAEYLSEAKTPTAAGKHIIIVTNKAMIFFTIITSVRMRWGRSGDPPLPQTPSRTLKVKLVWGHSI
jgi:hypothetical protein